MSEFQKNLTKVRSHFKENLTAVSHNFASFFVPGGELLEVLLHVRLFRISDGEHGQIAVHHSQHDAVPVCRALQRTTGVVGFKADLTYLT